MSDYPCPWPSEAARERAHIRAIRACVREKRGPPEADQLRALASVHLEFARPDMAEERKGEGDAPSETR